jgi:hypothetical protein
MLDNAKETLMMILSLIATGFIFIIALIMAFIFSSVLMFKYRHEIRSLYKTGSLGEDWYGI